MPLILLENYKRGLEVPKNVEDARRHRPDVRMPNKRGEEAHGRQRPDSHGYTADRTSIERPGGPDPDIDETDQPKHRIDEADRDSQAAEIKPGDSSGRPFENRPHLLYLPMTRCNKFHSRRDRENSAFCPRGGFHCLTIQDDSVHRTRYLMVARTSPAPFSA